MATASCRIGTSGWRYPSWTGTVLPPDVRGLERLSWLAREFGTIEITASGWDIPTASQIERWRDAVDPDVVFSLTLWHGITYGQRLVDCRADLDRCLTVAHGLGPSRGPLLIQLPPTLHRDETLLADFLVELDQVKGDMPLRVAIEFRSADWLSDAIYDLCDRHRVAICCSDLPRCPCDEPNDVGFVYMRRNGPDGSGRSRYSADLIERDAREVREQLAADRDVYVYYRNAANGAAVLDARALGAALGPLANAHPLALAGH